MKRGGEIINRAKEKSPQIFAVSLPMLEADEMAGFVFRPY